MKKHFQTFQIFEVIVLLAIASTLFVTLPSCNSTSTKNNQDSVLKVGLNFTMTGSASFWCQDIYSGLAFAKKNNVNGNLIEFQIEDNKMENKTAITIQKLFYDRNDIDLTISGFSSIGTTLRDYSETNKLPLLATICSANDFAKNTKYVFRDFPTQKELSVPLSNYVFKVLKYKKGATLVVNDDYGLDGAKLFISQFTNDGGTISGSEVFEKSANDFRNVILKVLNKKPEFVYIVGRDRDFGNCVNQLREMNSTIPILGTNLDLKSIWDLVSDNAENNIYFTSAYYDLSDTKTKLLIEKFNAENKTEFNYLNLYGLTIGNYLIEIAKKGGNTRENICKYLRTLNTNSLRGTLVMNGINEIQSNLGLYLRNAGKTVLLEKPKQ